MPKPSEAVKLVSVRSCSGPRCANRCSGQSECVVTAVSTTVALGSPVFYYNEHGGEISQWVATSVTTLAAKNFVDHLCLNGFVVTLDDTPQVMRSTDQGISWAVVSNSDLAANAPLSIDGLDRTRIFISGANGYIYGSSDGMLTLETLSTGSSTTEDLKMIRICPTNSNVIYAVGDNNAIVRSTNGGETWYALTGPSVGDNLLCIDVVNENKLLVGNDDGEIWQSDDGGETWAMQLTLPSQPTVSEIRSIIHYGNSDVFFLICNETGGGANQFYIYRNVNGGSSGNWYLPEGSTTSTYPYLSIAACDHNHVVAVGGLTTHGVILVLE